MSLFNRFFTLIRGGADVVAKPDYVDSNMPDNAAATTGMNNSGSSPVVQADNRKNVRLERRELIYTVVRDAMLRAGVLAATYKFKVLSLDSQGSQYVIMMDLANHSLGDAARLAEIEALIAQMAKSRHDMLITAVYWRVSEQVTAGLSRGQRTATTTADEHRVPAYEPIQDEEVAAFKRALGTVTQASAQLVPGKIITTGRRNPAPPEEFEDTHLVPTDRRASPLSGTQYGDLT